MGYDNKTWKPIICNTKRTITVFAFFCLLILDAKVWHNYLVFRNNHAEGYALQCFCIICNLLFAPFQEIIVTLQLVMSMQSN